MGFPGGSPANAGDAGSIPMWRKSPGEGNGNNPLQHSCLENSMDRGAWHATVRGVTKSQVNNNRGTERLSDLPKVIASKKQD